MLTSISPVPKKGGKLPGVISRLQKMAHQFGPSAKLPTVRALGKMFEVSTATIIDALRELEAGGVLQTKHGSGIYVSPFVHHKTIALIFGEAIFDAQTSSFYSLLLGQCEQRIKSHGENFMLFLDLPKLDCGRSAPVQQEVMEAVRAGKIDGILLIARNSNAQEEWLRSQGLSVVSLGISPSAGETVVEDYEAIVEMGVDELVRSGCTRIGLVSPFDNEEGRFPWDNDVVAFQRRLKAYGLKEEPAWIVKRGGSESDYGPKDQFGRAAFTRIFNETSPAPDGLLILDDIIANGVLSAAGEVDPELRPPVTIASHANKGSFVLRGFEDQLILLEMDPAEVAAAMLKLLEKLMSGKGERVSNILVRPHLRIKKPLPLK